MEGWRDGIDKKMAGCTDISMLEGEFHLILERNQQIKNTKQNKTKRRLRRSPHPHTFDSTADDLVACLLA